MTLSPRRTNPPKQTKPTVRTATRIAHFEACTLKSGVVVDDGSTPTIFVGECRSLTAQRKNWTWRDGRLAAKPLFEALAAMGIDPALQIYVNLWTDDSVTPTVPWQRVARLREERTRGVVIVALGQRVSRELVRRGVDHVAIVHPAARGRIRKRERYVAHVRERLSPHMQPKASLERTAPRKRPDARHQDPTSINKSVLKKT